MGDTVQAHGRRRWVCLVMLTLATLGLLGAAAPAALAFDPLDIVCDNGINTMHGDALVSTSCYSCHGVVAPVEPIAPVDTTKCLACHWGGYENRPADSGFDKCWSCHYPGTNQDVVQNEVVGQTFDGCAAATDCHAVDPAANLPHYGANTKTCTDGCHRSSSQSNPNGSQHHDDGRANCYDCHDGAKTLEKVHEPYVNPRDVDFGGPFPQCYTCHVGYEVTHPDPESIVHRTTLPVASSPTVVYGGTTVISGILYTIDPLGNKIPVSGMSVSLLRYSGVPEFDWNTLQLKLTAATTGKYTFDAVAPLKNTTYAALAKGQIVGSMFAKPARGTVLVKVAPKVTETLNKTSFTLGGTITVTGKVVPSKTAGKVKWVFQRYVDGAWTTVKTTETKLLVDDALLDFSTASYTYKPAKKGSWRVKTTFVATTEYTTASSVYKTFTVK